MALSIDVDRALRRPTDLARLVEAVVAGKRDDEADWIEWKSTLDLTTGEGIFSLARQILGSAHRQPDQAARFMQGLGYIVVGAQPGSVEGVTAVDLAKVDASLEKYLGPSGPVWGGVYVDVHGKDVLVVTVDAPRWGDRVYPLAKTFQPQRRGTPGADAGAIFIRKQARTVPAGPGDIQMLQDRLLRGEGEQALNLIVEAAEPEELVTLDVSAAAFDEWIERRREAVLAMDPPPRSSASDETLIQAMLLQSTSRDRRSRDEYVKQVEEHLTKCRKAIQHAVVHEAAASRLNLVVLKVTNPTPRNLPKVELTLRIDTPGLAFKEDEEHDWKLPTPPQAFGTPSKGLMAGLKPLGPFPSSYAGLVNANPVIYNPNIRIANGPPIAVELSLGDIRPHAVLLAEPFLLVMSRAAPGSALSIEWSATSTRVDARQQGVITLPVQEKALKPVDLISYSVEDHLESDD